MSDEFITVFVAVAGNTTTSAGGAGGGSSDAFASTSSLNPTNAEGAKVD